MPTVSPLLLTCAEVCKLLSVSRSTLDRLGETVPGRVKLGGQVRYHRETLENWLLDQVRS
jgi:excisionase family DNA binding protein